MKPQASAPNNSFDDPLTGLEEAEERSEDDLWFLPGPIEDEPDDLPPGPKAEPRETAILVTGAKPRWTMPRGSPVSQVGSVGWTSGCGGGLRVGATGSP